MSKYSADIEIAVRGGQQLDRTIKTLNRLNNSINVVTRNAKLLEGKGFNVASIENYSRAVSKAERAVRKAAEGTNQERQAITAMVSAMELENKARERKNILIAREIANQRRVIATANAGVGVQGPAIPAFMRTGPSSPIRGSRALPGSPAALAAGATGGRPVRGGGGGGRLGGAISGSIIGGAFPLLFGQGAGAAAGGAVGGLVGGLAGPGGSFAGSLLGTLLGDLASKGQAVKELAEDMGLAAEGTKQLGAAFQAAGRDADKFAAAVQTIRGIGFADGEELEAIKLVSKLTEDYGGKIDKVTAAYGNFVAKGKVGIADINKFTAQGIPILDELEKSYGKNRSQILDMAKAGDITAQALSDALVRIANRSDEVTKRTSTSWEQVWDDLKQGASTSANAFAVIIGSLVGVSANVTGNIATFFSQLYVNMVNGAVNAAARVADALASTANNIAAFYKANPLAFGPARDLAVSGLEQFKTGARGTAKQLRALTQAAPKVGQVGAIQVPGQLPGSEGGGGGGKSTSDRAAEAAAKEAERVQEVIRNRLAESQILRLNSEIQDRIAEAEAVGDKMLVARLQGTQRELDIQYRYAQELAKETDLEAQKAIIYEGQTALVANQRAVQRELNQLELDRLKTLEEIVVGIAEETALAMATSPELRQKLELEQKIAKWKKDGVIKSEEEANAIRAANTELEKQKKIREQINTQQQMLNDLYDGIANQIAGGVGSAIDAVASGVDNLGDSLKDIGRDILAAVGKMLIFYAIAQALGALGGNDGVGFFSTLAKGFGFKAAKDGGYWPGGFSAFADGGVVTKPTMGLVGEGGEPEYIIPASKMSAAMKRYGGGARGSAVIPTSGDTSEAGGNATTVNGAIDVRYTVERINSVDYVTADQFQQGMQQAATQGAQRGEQQALRRLQNSASTRRRLGV